MTDQAAAKEDQQVSGTVVEPKKDLPPAAQRALAEAQARRDAGSVEVTGDANLPKEINGRGGKEPTRYSDWEVKGLAVDF
ncbi:MAG: DUF1674 domain-containing protein [Pseudomonadota bacterium]